MPSTVLNTILGIQEAINQTVDNLQGRRDKLEEVANAIKGLTLSMNDLLVAMQMTAEEGVGGFDQLRKISIEMAPVVLNIAKRINIFLGTDTSDGHFDNTLSFALHEIVALYTAPFLPNSDTSDSSDDEENNADYAERNFIQARDEENARAEENARPARNDESARAFENARAEENRRAEENQRAAEARAEANARARLSPDSTHADLATVENNTDAPPLIEWHTHGYGRGRCRSHHFL